MGKIKTVDKNGEEWEFEETEAIYRKSVYGCAIYDAKVLMVLDPRSGKWELPGGGVDPEENEEQALIREIKEETGLDADTSEMKLIEQVHGYFKSTEQEFPWKTDRSYFQIKIKNPKGSILSNGNGDDIAKCKWVPIKDKDTMDIDKVDNAMIQKITQD